MARDNFSKKDIITLRTRVGDRCSNPNCRKTTVGPSNCQNKATIIGDAAHICAASKGGPRYDPLMTSSERKSISNAIWLCKNCARQIDVDHESYPKELLYEWKKSAEQKAYEELNQALFNQNEVNTQIVNSVSSMVNGIQTTGTYNLVHNAIQAEIKTLENKDPRFSVTANFDRRGICYQLKPKESIEFAIKYLNVEEHSKFIEKHTNLIRYGHDMVLSSKDISLTGSALLAHLISKSSIITISSKKQIGTFRLRAIEPTTKIIEPFNDIIGSISFGTESLSFYGTGFADTLSIKLQIHKNSSTKISITPLLVNWEAKSILELPYFSKIWKLFECSEKGWELFFELELEGETIVSNAQINLKTDDRFCQIYTILQYTNYCRNICRILKYNIPFTTNISFSAKEHEHIAEVESILLHGYKDTTPPKKISEFTIILNEKNIQLLSNTQSTDVRFEQKPGEILSLFNNKINLPPKIISLNSVIPKIVSKAKNLLGKEARVLLYPSDNYEFLIEYKKEFKVD